MVKIAKLVDAIKDAQAGRAPRFVIIHGPDRGICAKNLGIIADNLKSRHPNLEMRSFNEDDLARDFTKLEEAIMGSSLFGGASIARLNIKTDGQGSKLIPLLQNYGEVGNIDGALFINGAGLAANSKLVAAFEKAQSAWAIRTYEHNAAEFAGLIREKANQEGVKISNEAVSYLIEITVQDSEILLNEIENLSLYVGKGNEITIDAINELSVGGREGKVDEILNAAFSGLAKATIIKNYQSRVAGLNQIQILNALVRRLRQLMFLRADFDKGQTAEAIVKDRRHNIFWKDQENFKKQIAIWTIPALESVYSRAVQTDILLKQSNYPIQETLEKLFISIADFAARKRGR